MGEAQVQAEKRNLANIFKAGRLIMGKTQAELSKTLEISQSNISKFESMHLEPSASDWYKFCQFVGIDAHQTLSLGYIDGRKKFKHRLFKDDLFKIPLRYRGDWALKVRELIPFKKLVCEELGEDVWESFLVEVKLAPEVFFIYDYQLSLNFLFDLAKFFQARAGDVFLQVQEYAGDLRLHGSLSKVYAKKKAPIELLKALIENQPLYQKVFRCDLQQTSKFSKVLIAVDKDIEHSFDSHCLERFISYKISSFQEALRSNLSYEKPFQIGKSNGISFSMIN